MSKRLIAARIEIIWAQIRRLTRIGTYLNRRSCQIQTRIALLKQEEDQLRRLYEAMIGVRKI